MNGPFSTGDSNTPAHASPTPTPKYDKAFNSAPLVQPPPYALDGAGYKRNSCFGQFLAGKGGHPTLY